MLEGQVRDKAMIFPSSGLRPPSPLREKGKTVGDESGK